MANLHRRVSQNRRLRDLAEFIRLSDKIIDGCHSDDELEESEGDSSACLEDEEASSSEEETSRNF